MTLTDVYAALIQNFHLTHDQVADLTDDQKEDYFHKLPDTSKRSITSVDEVKHRFQMTEPFAEAQAKWRKIYGASRQLRRPKR